MKRAFHDLTLRLKPLFNKTLHSMQGRIFTPCQDFLQQFNRYHHYCLVQRIKRENTHTQTKISPNKKNMSLFHLASTLLSPLIKLISWRAERGDYCPNNNYRLWEISNKTSKLKTRSRPTADNEDLTSSKFITRENNIVHLTIIFWRIQSSSCIWTLIIMDYG